MAIEEIFKSKQDIINTLRTLWAQHAKWTRMLIICSVENLPDLNLVSQRLIKNSAFFADEIKKYYGKEKAKIFEDLLFNHLLTGQMLIDNVKKDNVQAADECRRQWYENADDFAEFLSDINAHYNEHEWRAMLYDHLYMTENELSYRLKGDHESEISEYDNIDSQVLRIADMMSDGIIKQFI